MLGALHVVALLSPLKCLAQFLYNQTLFCLSVYQTMRLKRNVIWCIL